MQNVTKKKGAILSALVVAVMVLCYLGVILYAMVSAMAEEIVAVIYVGIYAAVSVAAIIGVFAALRQRLKELDSGEEEEAKKY